MNQTPEGERSEGGHLAGRNIRTGFWNPGFGQPLKITDADSERVTYPRIGPLKSKVAEMLSFKNWDEMQNRDMLAGRSIN